MIKDIKNIIFEFARDKNVLELEGIFVRGVLEFEEFHPDEYQLQQAVRHKYDFSEQEELVINEEQLVQIALAFATESYFCDRYYGC